MFFNINNITINISKKRGPGVGIVEKHIGLGLWGRGVIDDLGDYHISSWFGRCFLFLDLLLTFWGVLLIFATVVFRSGSLILLCHVLVEDTASLSIFDDYDSGGGIFYSQLFSGIRYRFSLFLHFFDQLLPSLNKPESYLDGDLGVVVLLVQKFHGVF